MDREQALTAVEEIFSLYQKYGNADYIGEPVSQVEHMSQAAQLAEAEGYENEVVLAAFFHDIGHLYEHIADTQSMNGYGTVDHDLIAGNYLRQKGFSEKIARLVENHVQAKRYLIYKYPDYYNKLSAASQVTLVTQGGIMDELEAQNFEADSLCNLYIKIREWDDKAKLENQPLPGFQKYRDMTLHHLLLQH